MSNPIRPPYSGPALFSYGFRPFFLIAGLYALIVVPVWMCIWTGQISLQSVFAPVDWHIHEMLFGYTSAVIAGFLFTAIPNWTGRMPTRGWPLALLALLWITGRLAVGGAFGLGPVAVMAIDCAFMAAIATMAVIEIAAGRNWGNLKVVVPVLLYLVANITFHVEAMLRGQADYGRRLGFAMVVMLILLIGGRIIPSFTRNWLVKQSANPGRLPAPFARFDGASLAATLAAVLLWVALPESTVTAAALMLAGLIQLARLARWCGWRVAASPLLLMLHVAFLFIPLGLIATGFAIPGLLPAAAGLHLLGIGGIGGMTLAVMMRAARGHTGRELEVGAALTAAFASVIAAALVRAAFPSEAGLWLAAGLWTIAFLIFLGHYAAILAGPSAGRKTVNSRNPG